MDSASSFPSRPLRTAASFARNVSLLVSLTLVSISNSPPVRYSEGWRPFDQEKNLTLDAMGLMRRNASYLVLRNEARHERTIHGMKRVTMATEVQLRLMKRRN